MIFQECMEVMGRALAVKLKQIKEPMNDMDKKARTSSLIRQIEDLKLGIQELYNKQQEKRNG